MAWSKCGGVLERYPGQIRGDDAEDSHPGLLGTPSAQVRGGVALDQVGHPPAIQIDEAGHVDGVVLPLRREERGLVGSEAQAPLDAPGSLTSWCLAAPRPPSRSTGTRPARG